MVLNVPLVCGMCLLTCALQGNVYGHSDTGMTVMTRDLRGLQNVNQPGFYAAPASFAAGKKHCHCCW
jgi:hypothetical protein